MKEYMVYLLTNKNKTVLYVGVTNDLKRRLYEHSTGTYKGFSHKYNCYFLLYFETFNEIDQAIEREKEVKKWSREKKEALIATKNPEWKFLNDEILN
ncbi:MAG: GIY-YIG nuclease family protein [Prolixibacteraceae bacterium]|jgi:putative endonuclease|nr:GIY-YIG nuclease family protein [Prolixibacteraceae bacterium]